MNDRQIIYKRGFLTDRVVLKPDTWSWRLRYWLNQYGAAIAAWIIWPVIKWNYSYWRIDGGEKISSIHHIERMGMMIKEPEPFIVAIIIPSWIRKSKKLFGKAFEHFRNVLENIGER